MKKILGFLGLTTGLFACGPGMSEWEMLMMASPFIISAILTYASFQYLLLRNKKLKLIENEEFTNKKTIFISILEFTILFISLISVQLIIDKINYNMEDYIGLIIFTSIYFSISVLFNYIFYKKSKSLKLVFYKLLTASLLSLSIFGILYILN